MTHEAKVQSTQKRITHAIGQARRAAITDDLPVVWGLIAVAEEIRALRLTLRQEIRNAAFEGEEADDE